MTCHGKEKKNAIPDGTPAVTIAAATKDDLVPGAVVFITAEKAATGPVAHQVLVGKNGDSSARCLRVRPATATTSVSGGGDGHGVQVNKSSWIFNQIS